VQMVENGVQILGAMMGVTAGGAAGGKSLTTLDAAVETIDAIMQASLLARKDVLILAHGGPLNNPDSVAEVLRRTGVHGYVTGSTGERIPVEVGVAETIRRFKTCTQ
jgi:predicted TIM-barrel enzyme